MTRGAERQTEHMRGSENEPSHFSDEEGRGAIATKVLRGFSGKNDKKIFSKHSRSIEMVESQSGGRRPGLQAPAHLTRATVKAILARRKRRCSPDERRECGDSERESGALAVAPSGDRGRQRSGLWVTLLQPKGAKSEAANETRSHADRAAPKGLEPKPRG